LGLRPFTGVGDLVPAAPVQLPRPAAYPVRGTRLRPQPPRALPGRPRSGGTGGRTMRAEAFLFAGVAVFFAVTAACYGHYADDPAGTAVLPVCFLMSALVTVFLWIQHLRRGDRPQDRGDAVIADGAGPVDFFPPRSGYPALTALGVSVLAL